jgi:hypothetical protein
MKNNTDPESVQQWSKYYQTEILKQFPSVKLLEVVPLPEESAIPWFHFSAPDEETASALSDFAASLSLELLLQHDIAIVMSYFLPAEAAEI